MQTPAKYAYLLTRQLEAHEAQYAAEWQIRETRANETSSALRRAIESKLRGRRAEEAEALRLDIYPEQQHIWARFILEIL